MRKPGYQTEPASPTRLTTLAWINNLFLMFVGLIPFGTLLIGIFGFTTTTTTTTALAYGASSVRRQPVSRASHVLVTMALRQLFLSREG